MGTRTASQNSKLQNFPSEFQSESTPEHHNSSSTQSWVTFKSHHSLVLLLFVCEMLTRLLRKCFFLIDIYPFFRLLVKIPFQTMPDLSWHTSTPSLHCMCLASKAQCERDHLLLLVPILDGRTILGSWGAAAIHKPIRALCAPSAPNAWLQCSMIKEVWQLITLMLNYSQWSLWGKSVWTNLSKKSPSRSSFYLAAETGIEALLFSPVDFVCRLHRDTSLKQRFWPWCSHHSPPAIACQPGPSPTASTSCHLCQLFLLALPAALHHQPVCCILFISHLFISTPAVTCSPATFTPVGLKFFEKAYSATDQSTWTLPFFLFCLFFLF